MTSVISSEVGRLFATARIVKAEFAPITRRLRVEGVTDDSKLEREARRALLAKEYFKEYGPWNAPPLPTSMEEMAELAKTDDYGLAVASFARSLELNDWDIDRHPRYQEYMAGLLSLPRFWRTPPSTGCILRRTRPNFLWHPSPFEVTGIKRVFCDVLCSGSQPSYEGN